MSRSRCRDRGGFAQGFVLLEWVLAAALGVSFAAAVVAALIGFRRQATTIAETVRLQADAAIALRFLRHYIERAAVPVLPGWALGSAMRCDRDGYPVSEWSAAARVATAARMAPQWRCDLQPWRGALIIDYLADGDASWRDVSNRPADCQGASRPPRDPSKVSGTAVPMMRAALSIKVGKGDATPGLFCRGWADVTTQPNKGSSAIVDGVERLLVRRGASFHEICIVMRGRIRHAPTPWRASDGDASRAQAGVDRSGPSRKASVRGDRCEAALDARGKRLLQTDYVGTDGYRRHTVRVVWPVIGK